MEKQPSKSKDKILRFLPKSVSFQNRSTYSPGRNRRSSPMIPAEAREKSKNFETQEPTSPKISCMGQIKHKNKMCKMKHVPLPNEIRPEKFSKARSVGPGSELKKKSTGIKKLFSASRKSVDVSFDSSKPPLPERAPSLSQMRRFASSRDTLANFDWTTTRIAPGYDSDGDSDGEDDAVVPLTDGTEEVGGLALEPRKEINLWRRRTMAQPKPLQLNVVRAQ